MMPLNDSPVDERISVRKPVQKKQKFAWRLIWSPQLDVPL